MDEVVVRDAAHLHAQRLALLLHRRHVLVVHLERDVQVEVVLLLELERHVRRLEEGQEAAVVQPVEGVQVLAVAPGLGDADLQRRRQRQPQEVLVELARLFGVAAAIGVVMQALDARLRSVVGAHDGSSFELD